MPQNAILVRSVVLNGDSAHGRNIYRLFRQMQYLRHILFFDFELGSTMEERTLCASIPLDCLTSLSFSVLPAAFLDKALRVCSANIKHLRVYRVNLAAVDPEPWREDKPRWVFHNLRTLSLQHVGDMSDQVFKDLIFNNAAKLRTLKVHYEKPYAICCNVEGWQYCRFEELEHLELGSFHSDIVTKILTNEGDPHRYLQVLKLPSLREPDHLPAWCTAPSICNSDYKARPGPLHHLPKCVEQLEFNDCEETSVCYQLPHRLKDQKSWLPHLRSCPIITLAGDVIPRDDAETLEKTLRRNAATLNLPVTPSCDMYTFRYSFR
jgi:hypothetical protein